MEKIAASDILKNIYRKRKGTTYDFGLAEAVNDKNFLGKLKSLGDGKVYALGFFNGFVTTGSKIFLKAWFAQLVKVQKMPVFITKTT